ncbi:MAG: AMP-binding protein, partial [Muribaculaceae bacterium]|nr:AMP-binding protein [Muribaculaceae bacterium]
SLLYSRNKELTNARDHLNELFGQRWPNRFTAADVEYPKFTHDTLALINYTSGSTGFSKGVMLTYGNLWSNIRYACDDLTFLHPGDGMVCMLPLAHMYGLVFEMLHTFVKGCHIYFLTRTPSPKIIMEAFATVHPKLIITVPLILDKIIRTRVFPMLEKPMMKLLMHIPLVDNRLLEKIRAKLIETFGGNLQEIIIGGAPLNSDVEAFLRRIHFPFTVGYGMTECAPLITYTPWDQQRPQSCGRLADRMEARIDSPDPANQPGVLYVRGANVMKGYYKNPEATEKALSADGWLNTGDICSMDADGFLTIRGRDKSMILGPSGQNIYPEEIEQKLNGLPYVAESLVVDDDNKLVALVYPDFDSAHKAGMSDEQIEEQMNRNLEQLNTELPAYSRVARIRMMHEEFEKTPKRSIKRYLYQH